MKKIFFFSFFILSICFSVQCQNSLEIQTITRLEALKIDGKNTLNSVIFTYKQPGKWKKKNWLTAGGIALGTIGLFLIDEEAHPYFIGQKSKIPEIVDHAAFYFGKPQYNYGITASVYVIGWLLKKPKMRKTGVALIASATAAGLIQTVSKTVFGRARPNAGLGNHYFELFSGEPNFHSFPSGHTILAFTTAYVLAKEVRSPWLKAGISGLGLITPVSRLWSNAHWSSDVGLSLAISIVTAESVFKFLNKQSDYGVRPPRISWKLSGGLSSIGLVGRF